MLHAGEPSFNAFEMLDQLPGRAGSVSSAGTATRALPPRSLVAST